uniref:Uncharacterized protein n=1 Tax=Vespula pensylvanica TaxID=30213 RepID=A0A834P828_VESPE|nr:hypothetical protein H0235_004840 [Vespula pensylvanica]
MHNQASRNEPSKTRRSRPPRCWCTSSHYSIQSCTSGSGGVGSGGGGRSGGREEEMLPGAKKSIVMYTALTDFCPLIEEKDEETIERSFGSSGPSCNFLQLPNFQKTEHRLATGRESETMSAFNSSSLEDDTPEERICLQGYSISRNSSLW